MSGAYDLLISDHIIDEVIRNLEKPYFAAVLKGTDAPLIFQEIRSHAEMVDLSPHSLLPSKASHPEDNYVLAAALEGHADYLVTGDKQLQKIAVIGDTAIVGPAEMLRILEEWLSN
jgi:predicted nucleic acid-binding protein